MRKKEKLDRQGQAKNLFGSYSPEYQQLIEGINLVLQLSLSTMPPSLPSLDKATPLVKTQYLDFFLRQSKLLLLLEM
jgi:hypothetical protein